MKATIRKANGTVIEAEGTAEDIRRVAGDDWMQPPVHVPSAFTFTPVACQHDFPSPKIGGPPPSCRKCGMQALTAVTFTAATAAIPRIEVQVAGVGTRYIHPYPAD